MTLQEKLHAIQSKLTAPKTKKNDFGKYFYRNVEDILKALKPHLDGAAITLTDEIVQIGERYYIKATATLHYDSASLSVCGYARESDQKKGMDSSQITGSASSYARKYALCGLFAVDSERDADSRDNREDSTPVKREVSPHEVLTDYLTTAIIKKKITAEKIQTMLGISHLDELQAYDSDTIDQMSDYIKGVIDAK